jgi:UDP-N-acetylglucosamine 2-epimerase (non-hydrolysing)
MILVSYGTRPEYIKVLPLINQIPGCKVLFTGQHESLGGCVFDYVIKIQEGKDRLGSVMASIVSEAKNVFDQCDGLSAVVVQGDTTSAVSVAIAALHNGVKVIHLEAGLRTDDKANPYPEEVNRRIISQIADLHLCPTYWNAANLKREHIIGDIEIVGNTGLDGLFQYRGRCIYGSTVLVTLHRRENIPIIREWFMAVNLLAQKRPDLRFVIPIHHNPSIREHSHLLTNVDVIEPLSRDALLDLLVRCRMVITDSGGLQEECSFFNKICLVCRKTTERPEALDGSSALVPDPAELWVAFNRYVDNYVVDAVCPFGDGNSVERVIKVFKKFGILD